MRRAKPIVFTRANEKLLENWLMDVSLSDSAKGLQVNRRTIGRWRQRIKDGDRLGNFLTVNRMMELIKFQNKYADEHVTIPVKNQKDVGQVAEALNRMGYRISVAELTEAQQKTDKDVITDDDRRAHVKGDSGASKTDVSVPNVIDGSATVDDVSVDSERKTVTAGGKVDHQQGVDNAQADGNQAHNDNATSAHGIATSAGHKDNVATGKSDSADDRHEVTLGSDKTVLLSDNETTSRKDNSADDEKVNNYFRNTDVAMFDYENPDFNVIKLISVNNDEEQRRVSIVRVDNLGKLSYQYLVRTMAERHIKILTTASEYQNLLKQTADEKQSSVNIQGIMER